VLHILKSYTNYHM